MDSPGAKFADLKKEDRYKRLEHNLKLAFVKQMERMKNSGEKGYYCSTPIWPSLSSIHPDGTDMSCAPSLQVSRVESEVLSSSKDLRKMLAVDQIGRTNSRLPMSTSSVKKFPIDNSEKDRAIMPPPSTSCLHNMKRTSNIDCMQSTRQNQQGNSKELEVNDHDSFIRPPIGAAGYENSSISQTEYLDIVKPRVFSRWRVLLNDQDHLIIKGTLECGKIARSKPVIQRLTSTKVLSIYKHIYELDGNIVDDRNELPSYVRGKFHNGFPDDWENVYQIWRNYRTDGCQITFRWPTPITDSDDDLQSEITNFSYVKNKQILYNHTEQTAKSICDNALSSGYHSKLQTDNNKILEKSNDDRTETAMSNIEIINKKIDDSGHGSGVKDTSQCNHEHGNKNFSKDTHTSGLDGSNSNLKNINFLCDIIQEDKVRIILSKLGDNNCPAQYLDKFIDLIDCLKYLLIYNPSSNTETIKHEQDSLSHNNQICIKCNGNASFSEIQDSKNIQKSEDSKSMENASSKKNYKSKKLSDVGDANTSSDSDDYMGFPNVSLSHLIKPKNTKFERFRDKKNRCNDRKNVNKNVQVKEQTYPLPNIITEQHTNSSVSISENDCEQQIGIQHGDFGNGVENDIKVPSVSNRINKNSVQKQKPVIKSCEPTNIQVRLKYSQKDQISRNSDISIVEDDVVLKKNTTTFESLKSATVHKNENAGLNKELMQFLTYDSEDILNDEEILVQAQLSNNSDKIQEKNLDFAENNTINNKRILGNISENRKEIEEKLLVKKKKLSPNTENTNKNLFGSKENPKVLASWIPNVVYDDEFKKKCSLTFEGKLLNEAGHILNRRFVTDAVRQRYSTNLVETISGQYYKLSGEINDSKHVLPKELLKQCRTGCPAKIKEFCEEWKRLTPVVEKSGSTKISSILDASIATSSRGRRIVRPLEYWKGEKIEIVDHDTVYNPGREWESTSSHSVKKCESLKKPTPSSERVPKNSTKEIITRSSKSSTKPSKTENICSQKFKDKQATKRVKQTLKYSSSSESDNKEPPIKKSSRKSKRKLVNNPAEPISNPTTSQLNKDILTESAYNMKLRKRQILEFKRNQKAKVETTKREAPESQLTWTYENDQRHSDILSDDQASIRHCRKNYC